MLLLFSFFQIETFFSFRVLDLNRKKEEAAKQKALEIAAAMEQKADSSEDDEEFDEYLDWRAKKSFR